MFCSVDDVLYNFYMQVKSYGKVEGGVEGMMNEIYQRGPITCSMAADDVE